MSASAVFDSQLIEMLYLYYSPFLFFDSTETANSFFEIHFYDFLDRSYTEDEILTLLSKVSDDCVVNSDSIVVGRTGVNLANDFSLYLMNFFDSMDLNIGDVLELDFGTVLYSTELPVYDFNGLFSPSKLELRFTDVSFSAVDHVLVSPVSDSMSSFLDSIGNVALIAVSVGVILLAGYALIRLIRRIL